MAYNSNWLGTETVFKRPLGAGGLESGHHFYNSPSADEAGNQSMLTWASLQQDTSALDAFFALFSLSFFKHSRFDNNLWKTMAVITFIWDLSTLFAVRTVAKRFTFATWQYCNACEHFRMAGQRTLRGPVIKPFDPLPGLVESLAANDICAACRKHVELVQQHYEPPRTPAITPWMPAPRRPQCNRQLRGAQQDQHVRYCSGTGDDYPITGDSD
jgi:hypothetical protein